MLAGEVQAMRLTPENQDEAKSIPVRPAPDRLPDSLDLARAVAIGLASNPDLTAAAERIRMSEEFTRAAWAGYWPTLDVDFSALYGDTASTYLFKRLDQRELGAITDINDPGKIQNYELGVTLRWNVFRGGADAAAVGMARHDQALARLGRESVRNELIAAVTNTFHDIISADELATAEAAAVDTVKAQLEEARARMKAGAVLKDEVLSLEVRLARAEDRSLAAANAGKLARAALASLLAVDTSSVEKIKCEDVPPPGVPLTLDRGLVVARENSPGYQSAKRRQAKARLGVKKASAPLFPALGLYGRYYLDDEYARFDTDRANWIVGADLTWSIFSGFSTTAQRAAAEAEERRTDARLRRAELELERRVKSAYIRLSDAQSRRKVAEAAVARADETLDLVAKRYGAGAVTVTRYLEAEQDRTFTRVNAIRARCNERRALAEVARVIGWWTSERKDQP